MGPSDGIARAGWRVGGSRDAQGGWHVYLRKNIENGRLRFGLRYPSDVLEAQDNPMVFMAEDVMERLRAYELCEIVGHEWGSIVEWNVAGAYSKECAVCHVELEDFRFNLVRAYASIRGSSTGD